MKVKNLLPSVVLITLCGGMTSCSDDPVTTNQTRAGGEFASAFQGEYELYSNTQQPTLSILDFCLKDVEVENPYNYKFEFTEGDIDRIKGLDADGLKQLRDRIMKANGFKSVSEVEEVVDEAYNKFCEDMNEEELIELDSFIDQYIEMPAGISSIEKIAPKIVNARDMLAKDKRILYAAVIVDRIGRPLYDLLDPETRSAVDCKKIFAAHISVVVISSCWGLALSASGFGSVGGILLLATNVCEAITAMNYYRLCIKTRAV